jgi:predicted dehydrogenase
MSVNIGVIGYGYWGPNLVRNFSNIPECNVAMVSDIRQERTDLLKRQYPSVIITPHSKDVINSPHVDGVVIATSVETHYSIAREALLKGKHVLIEKPMASSLITPFFIQVRFRR